MPTSEFKGIVVCSFYSVPYSKTKTQLIQHITINYTELKTRYKDCFFLAGGDKNNLKLRDILDISPTLHMHNTKPTHGAKNIDILVSDMVKISQTEGKITSLALQKEVTQGPSNNQLGDNIRPPCHEKDKLHKKAYIDDLILLEKISLSNLEEKERIIGPLDWNDRFNLTLPQNKSILQHQLVDLALYTEKHSMVINKKKTKCILFNNSKTKSFMPQLSLEEGNYLEVIYQLKLVSLVINTELTWNDHISYTVARVNRVVWQLSRYRATTEHLITFYIVKIRSILMFGAVVFHSSLTAELSQKLELQQKRSLAVILGTNYRSYSHALTVTSLPRLDILRKEACSNGLYEHRVTPNTLIFSHSTKVRPTLDGGKSS